MSTIEKVLVQIFERKNRIIDHVKQQILFFDHQLASKCLIDGFVPPPWLLSSSTSKLNKEDLIQGLLLPHSQASIPYCSLYQQPVVTTDNVQLPHILCSRIDASNEGLDQCLPGKVDELDPSVTSPPQDCRDGMMSDVCPDHCSSLARIQRSKSRQRALEHRNSAKACKNNESCEKNGNSSNNQNKGSEFSSLQSDVVDKLELIRSSDIVVTHEVEKVERGQCRSKGRSENVYSGRVTRSRGSVQPSKSMSGLSGAGNTSSVAKQDDVVLTDSISESRQQLGVFQELLESKFVGPVHAGSLGVKTEGQLQSKAKGEDIYSGRLTRSRSSVQPPKSDYSPPGAGKSFSVAKQDGAVLTESINKSGLQHDAADKLLQFVKPVDVVTCIVEKEERGQCQGKERGKSIHSVSIKRVRHSAQPPKSLNGFSCAGKISDVAKCDGQHNVVDELLESIKPSAISARSCGSKEANDPQSNEKNVCQGRLKRSRSHSQQQNFENKHLKLDSNPDSSTDDGICKSMQVACLTHDLKELIKPCDITDECCGIKATASDNHTKLSTVVDQYNDGSTRSRANRSANMFKHVDSSNALESAVKQSTSKASNKPPYAKSSGRSKGIEFKDVSGTQVNPLPCANDSGLAELNQCDTIVADTDADSDELVETHSASSASNLNGVNDPLLAKTLNMHDRVDLETVRTSPHSESAMMVLPKQLDFDDLGESTLNEASSLISEREEVINSLEKRFLTPLPCADKLDEVTSDLYQEKYNPSQEKLLNQEAIREKEKESETDLNKTSGPGRTSNLNVVSLVRETPGASTDAVRSILPESNEISEQKPLMEDLSTTLKVSNENLFGNSLKDAAGSSLNTDTAMEYLFSEYEKLEEIKSVMSAQKASNQNIDLCGCPAVLADTDFTRVCSPALLRKASATSSDASEHPCVAVLEETTGHSLKQKMEPSLSQYQDADSIGRCIADDIDSVLDHKHAKSSENKVATQSIQPGRHFGTHMEGSWSHKRRKIERQQSNSLSLSTSSKGEDIMLLNVDMFLADEEDQNAGKCNWKENGGNESPPSNFMHKKIDKTSISSLPQETLESIEDHSVEGTRAVDPSSTMFSSTRKCTADENKVLLNVGYKSEFGNIEHFTCDGRSKQESKSQLGEDGVSSPCRQPTDLTMSEQSRPEVEGFIIQTDSEQVFIDGEGISFHSLDLPKTTIERAGLLEQLCKSAYVHTPLSQFPTTYRWQRTTDLYQSIPNGLLECMNLNSTLLNNDALKGQLKVSTSCFGEDINNAFLGGSFSDCLPFSSSRVTGDGKKPYLSPIGKLWDKITLNSGSSEKRGSLNPDLPCISEENENMDEAVDTFEEDAAFEVEACSGKREALAEIKECPNVPAAVSESEQFTVRDSLDSVNTTYSFSGTENGIKQKVGKHNASKRRDTSKLKQNRSMLPGANGTKRASESLRNRFSKPQLSEKTRLRKGGPSFSQKELKVNNIVSNVTSFIPIVQQKQAASVTTGKRDVKVKALEAAEAAKKLAEKKENDRKMKKEALKLERARLEQENLRQLELEKKKKEEERKKKEADMAAKKRQREEEERLAKERKRKHMDETRRQQRAPEEKLRSKKDENEEKCQAPDERAQTTKGPSDEAAKHKKVQKEIAGGNEGKKSEMEFSTAVASTSVKACTAIEENNTKHDVETEMSTMDRRRGNNSLIADTSQEQSYDISPYKVSDDEDEDDDEPNNKFVPSWASKNRVALVVASQQRLDPEVIFPPGSFCSISEVLLPRKLQQYRVS
ncbi:uncharacterized protein LOC108483656 isoform X2 [Gossypium arboreum]|uniref:uncharacterized protein LOC108483656 isoform X2 n=1 Tax=Gossypium arboreum TaxID=29729 RepID=UPI000819488A|nr:uncharacterized protein LOC108483656 isoform X2 [Gossypium arboreum]XP_052886090.1 uncharacterized protein LOC108483656 isoform X2 [Gossypium arboreum]